MLDFILKPKHIVSILQNNLSDRPAYIFLEDGQHDAGRITYRELDQAARAIAAELQDKKLIGQRVLLLYPAGLDFITAFMGCLYAGVVAVPVYAPKLSEFERSEELIQAIANDAEISGVLTTEDYISKAQACCDTLTTESKLFILDTAHIDASTVVTQPLPDIRQDTIAYLQYTSGSTSAPKAAIIRHENLLHNLKYTTKAWHFTKKSIMLSWAPHSHVYGLVCGLLAPLYQAGLGVIMPPDAFIQGPLRWLSAITKYRATHSGCPNFGYDLCIQNITQNELVGLNLKSWKVAINGGEQVQHETLVKFSQKFSRCGFRKHHFCSAYGMSELSGTVAVSEYDIEPSAFDLTVAATNNNPSDGKGGASFIHRKFMGNGLLLPGLKAVIVDPDTRIPVKKGKIGEIWLSGKSLVSGYWQRDEETKEVFGVTLARSKDAYFRTGDLGFIRKGEICLTGRLKELLVIYGKKYYPLDLEKTVARGLDTFPVTNERVIFTVSLAGKDRVIFLQEVTTAITTSVGDAIIKSIRDSITRRHGIDVFGVVLVAADTLTKTQSGKLQRRSCQRAFIEKKLNVIQEHFKMAIAQSDEPLITKNFQTDFIKLVASVLNIDKSEIDLKNSLSVYGFDSINIMLLASKINETYRLAVTPANLFEYTTLEELFTDLLNKNKDSLSRYYENSLERSVRPTPKLSEKSQAKNTAHTENLKEIAIIGMSGIFPGAANIDQFWDNLVRGFDAISEIPKERWDWEAYYGDALLDTNKTKIKWGGFIDDIAQFDASFFAISPREAELTDPQQRIFLQTVWKAIEDAGYATAELSKLNTGLYVGVFNSDYAELLQKNGISDAYTTTGLTHSILANRVSYLLNLHGPSEAIDTACSSSLVALHHAVQAIQNGDCAIAIAGGVNALLSPTSYLAASKAGMLSEDGRCKTFDKTANGYVRGEGVAAIVLKPLDQAKADGDHIYGIIKGTAVNHGGHVSSLTVPNPIAQADVIVSACQRANISANAISYIETHGTGTSLGDPIEINGLKKAFSILQAGEDSISQQYCRLGSVKTHIGHLEAAAGITGVIKVLLAMQYEKIPGNLHFETLNEYIDIAGSPFYIADKTEQWSRLKNKAGVEMPRCAGVSSFGFGGTNAHVILEEFANPITDTDSQSGHKPQLITLSAKTDVALRQRMQDLHTWLQQQKQTVSLSAISYTLNRGRNHFTKRCAFVVRTVAELQESLSQALQDQEPENFVINIDQKDYFKRRPIFQAVFKKIISELHSDAAISVDEYQTKLLVVGNFYVEGYDLEWDKVHVDSAHRISLPTYPFAKEYYWIPSGEVAVSRTETAILGESPNHVQQDILQHVSALLKMDSSLISLTASLSELGFDSIAFKELAVRLENHYGITLTPTVFFTYNSIEALSQYLTESHAEIVLSKEFVKPISEKNLAFEPIAIIGMQGLLPQSKDVNAFWEHILAGDDLVSEIPPERWDWRKYYGDAKQDITKTNSKWGGLVADIDKFDASFFKISAREANLMDPQHRLFMEVVWKTIEDAGYDPLAFSGQDVGLFAGIEFNEYQALMHAQQKIFHGHVATGNSHAMLANRISYFLDWHGPSEVIDTACSSSLVAIHRAVNAIHQRECTIAVAGGVSLMLNPETFVITSQLGALSSDGKCKTFDKSANGYVKGEGVVAVLLKSLQQAEADGDFIYGVIKGTAVNHGGKAQSLTAPNAAVQSDLLIKAYEQSDIDPNTISYIEAHGTGTELGDPIEVEGLKQAFHTLKQKYPTGLNKTAYCGLGSVKSNIGHLEPASGIAGMMKVLLAMQHKIIPGNLHFTELNPYIDLKNSPFYIVDKTRPWNRMKDASHMEIPRRAGISSFGFGGTNAHVVLEEKPMYYQIIKQSQSKPYYLITLSAKHAESLKQKMRDLHAWLKRKNGDTTLSALSFTLNAGRTHFDFRCALVVSSMDELARTLNLLVDDREVDYCIFGNDAKSSGELSALTETYQGNLKTLINYHTVTTQAYRDSLFAIANLYIQHYPIEWRVLHVGEKPQRLASLPSYPFMKQRYWFDAEFTTTKMKTAIAKPTTDLQEFFLTYLKQIFAEKLRLSPEQISLQDTYEVYGVDSLLGLEITNRLEEEFGPLPKTLLYERSHLNDLAQYFLKKHAQKVNDLYLKTNPTVNGDHPEQSEGSQYFADHTTQTMQQNSAITTINTDIAIIGLSGTYPMAKNLEEFWNNLEQGRDCVGEVPLERWNYKDYPVTVGGEEKYFNHGGFIPDVDKFDPLFFNIAPREAALMDPQERLFLQSAWTTIEDAGYTRERLQQTVNNAVGVFAGVTYNFYPLFIAEEWAKGNRLPLDIQLFSVANRISYFLNLTGPSYVIDTACSSSLAAIHLACESLARGECQMAIAGGVNLSLHPAKYHMLGSYSFLSDTGRCTSFAEGGTGYVPAEGVGSVLLKPLALALRDNDRIYGVIKGSSMNHGGKTSGYTVPNPNAQAALIKQALERANISPKTISYIEAHGTGTALGDPIEVRGLQEAFELYTDDKQFCAIGSVKSSIGHLESAAGISQLTKVLLQMRHQKLVPSLHAEKLNPFIDFSETPFYVQRELSDWPATNDHPRRAGVSSFGAGGTNIHLIVEEYPENANSQQEQGPYVFVLSTLNADRLHDYMQHFFTFLNSEHGIATNLNDLCYTLQVGRESMSARLAIVVDTRADLIQKIRQYLENPTAVIPNIWVNLSVAANTTLDENSTEMNAVALAQHWVNGNKISWEQHNNNRSKRIALPTYPFAKRRCWVSSQQATPQIEEKVISILPALQEERWLIFSDKELGFMLQDLLGKAACTYCFVGEKFEEMQDNIFYIHPEKKEDYDRLISRIVENKNVRVKGIIYLWASITDKVSYLFQALRLADLDNTFRICIVARDNKLFMTPTDELKQSGFSIQLIDLDARKNLREDAERIATDLQTFIPPVIVEIQPIITEKKIVSVSLNHDDVMLFLVDTLAELLGLDVSEIDSEVAFLNYGLDSISGINFVATLNAYYNEILSPMDLYRYPTVNQLAGYIITTCQSTVVEEIVSAINTKSLINSESDFLNEIAHLSDAEVNKMLEDELFEIDKMI